MNIYLQLSWISILASLYYYPPNRFLCWMRCTIHFLWSGSSLVTDRKHYTLGRNRTFSLAFFLSFFSIFRVVSFSPHRKFISQTVKYRKVFFIYVRHIQTYIRCQINGKASSSLSYSHVTSSAFPPKPFQKHTHHSWETKIEEKTSVCSSCVCVEKLSQFRCTSTSHWSFR